MGCGWRNFGKKWTHIDLGNYDHLDYKCDVSKPLPLEDNSAGIIYASHVISYFDSEQIKEILTEWKRILKPGGTLRLATPDFQKIAHLYKTRFVTLSEVIGPLYGEMDMDGIKIHHKIVYDYPNLYILLNELGFKDIKRWDWRETEHAGFDDHSQAYIPHMDKENGKLISLNIECKK